MWPGGVVVKALELGLAVNRSRVRLPAVLLPRNHPGQVVLTHIHEPLTTSSIIWYWPIGGDAYRPEK